MTNETSSKIRQHTYSRTVQANVSGYPYDCVQVVLTFESVDDILRVTIQLLSIKAIEQYFPVVLIMLY